MTIDQGLGALGFDLGRMVMLARAGGLDHGAVETALTTQIASLTGPDQSRKVGIQVVLRAAQQLARQPRLHRETLFILDTGFPDLRDRPGFAATRLKCLIRSGRRADLVAEAMRLLSNPHLQRETLEKVLDIIGNIGFWPFLPLTPDLAPNLIREIDRFLSDPQKHYEDWVSKVSATLEIRNEIVGPFGKIGRADWKEDQSTTSARLLWGLASTILMQNVDRGLNYEPDPILDRLWFDELLTSQQRRDKLQALYNVQDTGPMLAALANGQSVLVADFHVRVGLEMAKFLYSSQFPISGIARGWSGSGDSKDFGFSTTDPGTGAAVLKLAKEARRAPRIIYIFPDGPDGEQISRICLKKTVKIGRGAAALAYFGKTSVFFARSRWTGQQFQGRLVTGPSPADHSSLESYESVFADAVVDHMAQIIQSAPEDIGSYWTHLA